MNLYGLEVKVMETAEQFSFTPRLNDDDYPLSNIKKAIIRLTQPSGNYKELTINNPTESILLSYQDFYEITEGTYILTLRVTDTSDNLIIFPNLNSIVADVTDSSISIEGNVLSAAMVNDIYNKMKSEVIQGAKGDAATVSVGTVDTLNPDEEATVTNSGNSNNAVFNFGIPKGDKGDTGDIGDYCVSTGWLQSGFTFPDNASAIRLKYKIDTINGGSLLTLFCSVKFPKADMNAWGKLIATFPSNVTVDSTCYIFIKAITAGGDATLKVKGNQIILNTYNNLGNVGSDGLVEFNFNESFPVTLK